MKRSFFILFFFILSACASQTSREKASEVSGGDIPRDSNNQSETRSLDPLAFINVYVNKPANGDGSLVGGYTRFYVEGSLYQKGDNGQIQVRSYEKEKRNPIGRLFLEREISRVLSLRLTGSSPGIDQTTVLASASQKSNGSDGHSWRTEINSRRYLTPWFRIDPGASVSIKTTLAITDDTDSNIAANVVSLLSNAAGFISPQAELANKLTEQRTAEAAQFLDDAISGLFQKNIAEKSINEYPIKNWNKETNHINIRAYLPFGKKLKLKNGNIYDIGSWSIKQEHPRLSLFADDLFCKTQNEDDRQHCEVEDEIDLNLGPYQVLSKPLTENTTLLEAIRGNSAINTALTNLNNADADDGDDVTRNAQIFCGKVGSAAAEWGYNRFDTTIIIWALHFTDLLASDNAAEIAKCNLQPSFTDLGLTFP